MNSKRKKKKTKLKADKENIGKVFRGQTKYIDTEPKKERNYVVVHQKNKNIFIAKLKSLKQFDENNKNIDNDLVEINSDRYNLKKRTGVDREVFNKNRITQKDLTLGDKDVFKMSEEFKLGSKDLHRVKEHTRSGVFFKIKKK